jgi:hypothetical protein
MSASLLRPPASEVNPLLWSRRPATPVISLEYNHFISRKNGRRRRRSRESQIGGWVVLRGAGRQAGWRGWARSFGTTSCKQTAPRRLLRGGVDGGFFFASIRGGGSSAIDCAHSSFLFGGGGGRGSGCEGCPMRWRGISRRSILRLRPRSSFVPLSAHCIIIAGNGRVKGQGSIRSERGHFDRPCTS